MRGVDWCPLVASVRSSLRQRGGRTQMDGEHGEDVGLYREREGLGEESHHLDWHDDEPERPQRTRHASSEMRQESADAHGAGCHDLRDDEPEQCHGQGHREIRRRRSPSPCFAPMFGKAISLRTKSTRSSTRLYRPWGTSCLARGRGEYDQEQDQRSSPHQQDVLRRCEVERAEA